MTQILTRDENLRRGAPLQLLLAVNRLMSLDELWTRSLESGGPIPPEDSMTLRLIAAEMQALLTKGESLVPIVIDYIDQNSEWLDNEFEQNLSRFAKSPNDLARMRTIVGGRGGLAAFTRECCASFLGLAPAERELLNRKIARLDGGAAPNGDITHEGQCAIMGMAFGIAVVAAPPVALSILVSAVVAEECF